MLEVGSGAGRFTEWLLRAGAVLTSIDASSAVEANRATVNGGRTTTADKATTAKATTAKATTARSADLP